MARKKQHEEHVNLERYLISYADFITLLFATFVVLYALSQVDISGFKALEESIKQAFDAPSITQGSQGILAEASDSILEQKQADSVITPLMMEYMSQRYEEESLNQIEQQINEMAKEGELDGVEAVKGDRGLIIRFSDDYLFKSGSATLTDAAKKKLDKVGAVIGKKFILHCLRIEGHTDNQKMSSAYFPSNWELSSARASSIIRYYIDRFNFMPGLFTAVGYADTRPLDENNTASGRAKNRRIEILILKNKFMAQENPQNNIAKFSKEKQQAMQERRMDIIGKIEGMSDAAKQLTNGDKKAEQDAIMLNRVYEKEIHRISRETKALDSTTQSKITGQGQWLRPPAGSSSSVQNEKHNIKNEVVKEFQTEAR